MSITFWLMLDLFLFAVLVSRIAEEAAKTRKFRRRRILGDIEAGWNAVDWRRSLWASSSVALGPRVVITGHPRFGDLYA